MERSEAMKEALEIVKAQASVRTMSEDEIVAMVAKLVAGIIQTASNGVTDGIPEEGPFVDAKKSIKEASITCLECSKRFKILTRKHLTAHGLTPDEYRAKYGLKKGQPLACKTLARERRKAMQKSKLWERRQKPETPWQA